MRIEINYFIGTDKVSGYLVLFEKREIIFELVRKAFINSVLCPKRKQRKQVFTIK